MSNTIKLKRGSGSNPSASDLSVGELAIRTDNGKIFTKKDNGSVAEISGGGGIDDGDKGDITVSNSGETFTIDNEVVTSAKIADGTIVNADINASAAIAGSKISPDFGSQNIVTTGTLGSGDISITGGQPALRLIDSGENPDYLLYNNNGAFRLHDSTNNADRFVVNTDGHVDIAGNVDFGAGIDVTGAITSTGNITTNGQINIESTSPRLHLADTNSEDDFSVYNLNGVFTVFNEDDNRSDLTIDSNGQVDFAGNVDCNSGLDVTGDATISGGNLTITDGNTLNFGSATNNNIRGQIQATETNDAHLIIATSGGEDIAFKDGGVSGTTNMIIRGDGNVVVSSGDLTIIGGEGTSAALQLVADDGDDNGDTWELRSNQDDNDLTFKNNISGSSVDKLTLQNDGDLFTTGDVYLKNDSKKLKFGASDDLQIFHDGSHSNLDNSTGFLKLRSNLFAVQNNAGDHTYISVETNEQGVNLFYDNSKKFETTSGGVVVTGDIAPTNHVFLGDNKKAIFGAGQDLQIYHDGSHSYIEDVGTGNLRLNSDTGILFNSNTFTVNNAANSHNMITAFNGGAVELYHNNSKKFETTSTGVQMEGDINFRDSQAAQFGNSQDLIIFHGGGNSIINNNTGDLRIESNRLELVNHDSNEFYLTADDNGSVDIYHNGSKKLETSSSGISVTGNIAVSGTVDGRDLASDGSKLDGIASGANNITNNNQLTNGAGYITSAPSPANAAFAYINFNSTNNSIRGSFNVSSISDHGTGNFSVNFSSNASNNNYAVQLNGTNTTANTATSFLLSHSGPNLNSNTFADGNFSTSSFRFCFGYGPSSVPFDSKLVCATVHEN